MTLFWTGMLCAAMFFALSTVVTIVLIRSAPKIEDEGSSRRYRVRRRHRAQVEGKRVRWTYLDKRVLRRKGKSQSAVSPRKW
ncbi:hypothetical protein [Allorhodopirellula heiligendammensis]|uniref:hypothetical protein n=1 Tax=Allorhodopirellula heiligendammensis TaxID=2714739 RepID=UPI00265ED3EF|nr:hypothetical protein [Allorhodopirellula heiligendammensis]